MTPRVAAAVVLAAAVLAGCGPSGPSEAAQQVSIDRLNASRRLGAEYDTFVRDVANESDCSTLAAMGNMHQENGDHAEIPEATNYRTARRAIVANRALDVGCDITADEFDGFYGSTNDEIGRLSESLRREFQLRTPTT